jgi:hypothetical protein
MNPPRIHAVKKRAVVPVVDATIAGVRNIPIPMTRLTTIIVASNVVSLALILTGYSSFSAEMVSGIFLAKERSSVRQLFEL